MDKVETDVVTTEEMTGFIESLFKAPNPKCDPNWDLGEVDVNQLKDDVELVSSEEMTSFISGLFDK